MAWASVRAEVRRLADDVLTAFGRVAGVEGAGVAVVAARAARAQQAKPAGGRHRRQDAAVGACGDRPDLGQRDGGAEARARVSAAGDQRDGLCRRVVAADHVEAEVEEEHAVVGVVDAEDRWDGDGPLADAGQRR